METNLHTNKAQTIIKHINIPNYIEIPLESFFGESGYYVPPLKLSLLIIYLSY